MDASMCVKQMIRIGASEVMGYNPTFMHRRFWLVGFLWLTFVALSRWSLGPYVTYNSAMPGKDVTKTPKGFDLLKGPNVSFFKEEAADVAQKMEPKEASDVFINGLRPVVSVKETSPIEGNGDRHGHEVVECKEKTAEIVDRPCQCSCIPKDIESPDQLNLKEPLSAPF